MFQRFQYFRFGATLAIGALALAACSGAGRSMPATPQNFQPMSHGAPFTAPLSLAPDAEAAGAVPDTPPNVAGTYKGTYMQSGNGGGHSGPCTFTLAQSGSKITGKTVSTVHGHTERGSLMGTVAAAPGGGAKLTFTYADSSNSGNGHATEKSGALDGKVVYAAYTVTFKTTKQ